MTPALIVKGRDGVTAREPLRIVPMDGRQAQTAKAREISVAVRMAKRRENLDTFADLIADGHTIIGAAKIMGISAATATNYMRDIRTGLGGGRDW